MLTELEYFCDANLGGTIGIYYAPYDWFDQSDLDSLLTVDSLQTLEPTTGSWLKAPVLPTKKQILTETEKETKQGKYFDVEIKGIIPRMRTAVRSHLEAMQDHRYLVRAMDLNGNNWVAGTGEQPLRFLSRNTTAEVNGLNNYEIRFLGQVLRRAINVK